MPSGSWNNKGVSIQSSDFTDGGYAYQSLYQPVKAAHQNNHHHQQHHELHQQEQQQQQEQCKQIREGITLESHHFMNLSRVLKEVEDEGSLIPSPTRLAERKRRLSDDEESPSEDDGYTRHASIEQLKNAYSISLDSLNENNVEVSCRMPQESCRIDYDSDKTPTVDKSFWSESDDDSPVVEGVDPYYYSNAEGNHYHKASTITGTVLETPTNLNTYLPPCDQDIEKEIRNIGVVTDDYELNNELAEEFNEEAKSCSSHDATSTASSESLRSAYSLQTPALSSSPESYEMLYRSFEVATMMDKERKKNGVDISDPFEETLLDMLNKASPKLQRLNYHRGEGCNISQESSPDSLTSTGSFGAEGFCADQSDTCGYDNRPLSLDFGNTKAHSAEDLSSSRVITFAQIAQQRKRPEPREVRKERANTQEILPHWTELLSIKGAASSAQVIPGAGAQCDSQEQLPDAPRRPQSLPIQLRHLQKPTIRSHATPPQLPKGVTRTLSAPEGINTTQRTCRSWGEHDEGIGELSESEVEDLSPDPVNEHSPLDPPTRELAQLTLTHDDPLDFGGLAPHRRPRTTTWCGSFAASRHSLLSSREHLSDTDSLDSWQPPQPTDINANVAPNRRSSRERNEGSVSALYDARSMPLNTSLCRKNFLSNRDSVQRSRKRHYCKDTYAERMLQHGGVFISGTENKPFLLQDIDSSGSSIAGATAAATAAAKSRSLPRNLGVARRRADGNNSGRSRPKSMEGLPSFSLGFDEKNLESWTHSFAPLNKSKSQEEKLSDSLNNHATEPKALSLVPGVSEVQQQWDASDEADYASLNSFLLEAAPEKAAPEKETQEKPKTSIACKDLRTSGDECDIFSTSRRTIRIDNVAKDAEVKYIKHRPLKPIHVVDAEHHRKKVLERLSTLQPPSSAPPTGVHPQDWQSFTSHPTAATNVTSSSSNNKQLPTRGHRRQRSDVTAASSTTAAATTITQSQTRKEGFWAWATSRQQIRAKKMSSLEQSVQATGSQGGAGSGKRSQIRPLALNVAHEDWDTLDAMPPQVMKVSPREEGENASIDVLQKRALVAEVNAAVVQLLAHFAQAKSGLPEEKANLGNTWKTPDVGHLALHYLCPALRRILQDGLRPHTNSLLVGRIKNTTWTTVEATTQLGPGTRLLHELASTVSKDIRLKDSKLRTHAFFLGLLNIRCVETWLEYIRTHPESIRRLYEPTAFLSLINTAPFQQLFSDLLVAVQPLAQLPFNLDHGFEYGYVQAESMRQRERQQLMEQHMEGATMSSLNTNSLVDARQEQPEGGPPSSGFPTVRLFGRAPRRQSDGTPSTRTMNTGMYSSMTFARNARRVTPVGRQESSEQPTMQERLLRTVNSTPAENVSGHELEREGGQPVRPHPALNSQSNKWSLGWIKDFATTVAAQQIERAPIRTESNAQSKYNVGSGYGRSKSVDLRGPVVPQGMGVALSSGWGKIGASFSKMWSQMTQPEATRPVPSTPPPTPSNEEEEEQVRQGGDGESPSEQYAPTSPKTTPGSPVKALCHHLSMTEGELCFSKGDVLTVNKQVDHDWLLCSHGNETGLVHIEYVQGLE